MQIGLSRLWNTFQPSLFPHFDGDDAEISDGHRRLILILDNLWPFIKDLLTLLPQQLKGRKQIDRFSFVASFLAMKVLRIPYVNALIDRLKVDKVLRRICHLWTRSIPCEGTFSNIFKDLAKTRFAEKLQEEMVKSNFAEDLAHNVSRDSTAIEAREKPVKKEKKKKPKLKRGRPKKGEERVPKSQKRLDKQMKMGPEEMIADLPSVCDIGGKKNSKGNTYYWQGYKLHIDTIDGDIPVSAIITSASTHDSQVAIPLEELTTRRVKSLYSLMDSAYDAPQIKAYVESKGKVPVIDHNPRQGEKMPMDAPKKERYKARSSAERTNSNLKDNLGGREIRVRGYEKIMTSLTFGLIVIAVEQFLKLL